MFVHLLHSKWKEDRECSLVVLADETSASANTSANWQTLVEDPDMWHNISRFQSALQVPLGKLHVVNFEQVSVFCILDCIYTSVIIGDASVNPFIHCSVAMFLCYFDSNVYC